MSTRLCTAVISGCAILAACAPAPPSELVAQGEFAARTRQRLGDIPIYVETFEKTNGQMSERSGVPVYTLWYKATVRYPEGIRPECVSNGATFTGWNCMHFNVMGGVRPQPRGAVVTEAGSITFQKTERGWMPLGS